MNIFEKLLAISAEIGLVAKNLEIGYGNQKYKAVSEGDVLAAVKPLEIKYKVYSYPCRREIVDSGEIVNIAKDGSEKRSLYLRVKTTTRFVDVESPSDYIEIESYGDGVDTLDKASGKACTYSDKYSLLRAYHIQTGDDPDAKASTPYNAFSHKPNAIEMRKTILRAFGKNAINDRYGSIDALTDDQLKKLYEAAGGGK